MMQRREFLSAVSRGYAGLSLTAGGLLSGCRGIWMSGQRDGFDRLTGRLLREWCDGMLRHQINEPGNSKRDGALYCPTCNRIHGRCMDAVYPFLHLGHVTGDRRYVDAGIKVLEWAENVTLADGSWTNDLDPKSWRGTTIFGAIALAETLRYHREVLDEKRRARWMARLDQAAGGYLWNDFDSLTFTNVNYGISAIYGFNLFGRVLDEPKYIQRSRELAGGLRKLFTEPNRLLFGEGKPYNRRSGRGLPAVDLGYNVEESLNSIVLYALEENDYGLQRFAAQALAGHLEFMLPDGAWDNSWGTRQAKWSYWGSRTTDGCQPAFWLMGHYNPAFGVAAYKNAELLGRCTAEGLLHGGGHYVSAGIKPCIHHTFTHAKVMALVQDRKEEWPDIDLRTALPRETADGVKAIEELNVWLAARGPWRGTVSAYDTLYAPKYKAYVQQATGGTLAMLYHMKAGPILASSMAEYILVEVRNQQPQPGEDIALTPRIETTLAGRWYTNLFDLNAEVEQKDDGEQIRFGVKTTLRDRDRQPVQGDDGTYRLSYVLEKSQVRIAVERSGKRDAMGQNYLVLPIISQTGEAVRQVSVNRIEIEKPGGRVVVEAKVPLEIKDGGEKRIFNMVPGLEAVVVVAGLPRESGVKTECVISVV